MRQTPHEQLNKNKELDSRLRGNDKKRGELEKVSFEEAEL